jgi:hypothetical protein
MSRRTPGMPIPGTERTISAAEQAAALGLQPGSAPKEGARVPLTPSQARKQMSDQYVGETPDIGWETITVPGGRDVLDALGVDPATLPLGVEQELGPPQPRPERRPDDEGVTTTDAPSPPTAAEADELRAAYRQHAAKITEIAESAKQSGDAAREARAAEQVRASAALGERLKQKLGGKL